MEEEKKEVVDETSESVDEEEKKKGGIVFINKFVEKHGKKNSIIYGSVCIAAILALILGLGLGLGLKGEAHEHTYDMSAWSNDKTYHWHPSTCGHDVVDGKAEHTFKDEITAPTFEAEGYTTHTCTVCLFSYFDTYTPKLTHNYATTWSNDNEKHWHACTDAGYEDLKIDEANHAFTSEVTEPTYEEKGYTTYTCSVCSYSYKADETPSGKEQEELNKKLGIVPVFDTENQTVTYGMYPQTHVSDTATIAALNATSAESNGWYKYNDEYYAKLTGKPTETYFKFADGTTVETGVEYWFKCELITWKILSSDSDAGTYSLVSNKLLDAHRFDDATSTWVGSEIEEWLNADFYNEAFNLGSNYVSKTEIDGSSDSLYLLTNAEITSYFTSENARICKPSDYAIANGTPYYNLEWYPNNGGQYWTRSSYGGNLAHAIQGYGDANWAQYVTEELGVRPALTLNYPL